MRTFLPFKFETLTFICIPKYFIYSIVLISVMKRKKVINIALKSEMAQIFLDTLFLQMTQLL
jgi:hypothetical protein